MAKASRTLFSLAVMVVSILSMTLAQPPSREGLVDAGNGVKLYYRLVGSGSNPVVLVHGGPGFTSDYIADDVATIARKHSLLVYDQRGIGRSTLVSDSTALAAQRYVEDLEAIRKHFGFQQLTLLGHSWGVVPATLYAMQFPKRVRRMNAGGLHGLAKRVIPRPVAAIARLMKGIRNCLSCSMLNELRSLSPSLT